MSENYLHLLYLMGRDPVDHRKVRNRHHQLCGCETKVIQKITPRFTIRTFRSIVKGKVIFIANKINSLSHTKWVCK